jgi:hypothetical protein
METEMFEVKEAIGIDDLHRVLTDLWAHGFQEMEILQSLDSDLAKHFTVVGYKDDGD